MQPPQQPNAAYTSAYLGEWVESSSHRVIVFGHDIALRWRYGESVETEPTQSIEFSVYVDGAMRSQATVASLPTEWSTVAALTIGENPHCYELELRIRKATFFDKPAFWYRLLVNGKRALGNER